VLDRDPFRRWFSALLDHAAPRIERMRLADSSAWSMHGGFVVHRSHGFFSVVGAEWTDVEGSVRQQPFLDQREIGTLGFLLRTDRGRTEILVHAKIEPGNVGFVQLAPTCQATYSNALRLHGGEAPPFVELFPRGGAGIVYDVEQSEQGTRFLYKRNRNVLAVTAADVPLPETHRWLDVETLLGCLHDDWLLNTDARSVLVCAPWERLVGRAPFSSSRDGFGAELRRSLHAPSAHRTLDEVRERIVRMRALAETPAVIGLDALRDWSPDEEGISPRDAAVPFRVRQIRVQVRGREVPEWDQPIVDSAGDGEVLLACGRIEGVLHFALRAEREVGLASRVELTATVVVPPGVAADDVALHAWRGEVVAKVHQSEEGGRFHRDTNRYRIVDVGPAFSAGPAHFWLTLGDIRTLLDEPGWLTNEARSALSLLLPWM